MFLLLGDNSFPSLWHSVALGLTLSFPFGGSVLRTFLCGLGLCYLWVTVGVGRRTWALRGRRGVHGIARQEELVLVPLITAFIVPDDEKYVQ